MTAREIDFSFKSKATTPDGIARAIKKNVMFCEPDTIYTAEDVARMLASGEIEADGKTVTAYVL